MYSGLASEGLAVAANGSVLHCGWMTVPFSWMRCHGAEWRHASCPVSSGGLFM